MNSTHLVYIAWRNAFRRRRYPCAEGGEVFTQHQWLCIPTTRTTTRWSNILMQSQPWGYDWVWDDTWNPLEGHLSFLFIPSWHFFGLCTLPLRQRWLSSKPSTQSWLQIWGNAHNLPGSDQSCPSSPVSCFPHWPLCCFWTGHKQVKSPPETGMWRCTEPEVRGSILLLWLMAAARFVPRSLPNPHVKRRLITLCCDSKFCKLIMHLWHGTSFCLFWISC